MYLCNIITMEYINQSTESQPIYLKHMKKLLMICSIFIF